MTRYIAYSLILSALILYGCENGPDPGTAGAAPSLSANLSWPDENLEAHEYRQWIESPESGFTRNKDLNDLRVNATYVPTELKAIRELGPAANNHAAREEASDHYSDLEFYQVTLEAPHFNDEMIRYHVGDMSAYQERVQYYSFYANQDALLLCGGDTFTCPVHAWERTFQATNRIVLEFAFPADQLCRHPDKPRELVFNDRVFGNGPLHFNF